MFLKAALVWVIIAIAETVHGILRVHYLNRRLGALRARQIGVFSGSLIILAIGWVAVPWIAPATIGQCLWVGSLWATLMLAFDIALGRYFLRLPWNRVLTDFNPADGGFLGLGIAVLFVAPLFIAQLRDLI